MGKLYDVVNNLSNRLTESNIPNITKKIEGGLACIVNLKNGEKVDAICTQSSWGGQHGLLEIRGGVTEDEGLISDVFGGLSEDSVYERFKYCYENNTRYFKNT